MRSRTLLLVENHSVDTLDARSAGHDSPGRFFAGVVMKSMLAHVVVEYDVKLDEGTSPHQKSIRFGAHLVPNPATRIVFRKRGA